MDALMCVGEDETDAEDACAAGGNPEGVAGSVDKVIWVANIVD